MAKTAEELARDEAKKQQEYTRRHTIGRAAGWRLVDSTKETFLMPQMPKEDAFVRFKWRNSVPLLTIMKEFVTKDVLKGIHDGFVPYYDGVPAGIQVAKYFACTMTLRRVWV